MLPLILSRGLRLREPVVGRTEATEQFSLLSSLMKLRANLHHSDSTLGTSNLWVTIVSASHTERGYMNRHHSWFILIDYVIQSLNNKGTGKPLHTLNVTCSSTVTFPAKGHLLIVL